MISKGLQSRSVAVLNQVGRTLATYLAWAVSSVLAVIDMLEVWNLIPQIYAFLRFGNWDFSSKMGYRAISVWAIFFLGIPWIILVFYVENYYREGSEKGKLWKRFLRVTLYEVGLIAAVLAIAFVLNIFS